MSWFAVTFDSAAKNRIAQAEALEKRLRLEAFLGVSTDIGFCHLRPITIEDVLKLEYAENKIVCGGKVDESDLLHYCVTLRADKHGRDDSSFMKWAGFQLNDNEKAKAKIIKHAETCFLDVPFAGSNNGNKSADSQLWITSVMDTLFAEYGWSLNDCMSIPIAVAFQLTQRICKRKLKTKYALRNPILSQARAKEFNRIAAKG
jgi:hypothetical protein